LGNILREEYRLRVVEVRVLSAIFGRGGETMTGSWRKKHNDVTYDLGIGLIFG
jgi:hypothetical protein